MQKTNAFEFFNLENKVKEYSDMYKKLDFDISYPANIKREEIFTELLKKHQPKKIIDAGCGAGMPLIEIKKKGFDNDNNEEHKFLFTSLKNKRLYLIQLDKNFNLKNKDKIEAGSFDMKERVRDIIYIDKDLETYALFLENEPSLAIIRKKEQ